MPEVTIQTDVKPDPNATPKPNITGDGNRVQVDTTVTPKPDDKGEKLILGKFKDQAALEAAYTELEKKQSAPKPDAKQSQEQLTKAGVDSNALAAELRDKGELSAESKKALADAGVPEDVFVAGLKAQGAEAHTELAKVVGGEEQFTAVLEWAAANLSAEEAAAYNSALDAGNLAGAKMLLQNIAGRYTEAVGKDPSKTITGDTVVTSGVEPFGSTQQMVDAMRDRRYQTDPAYREMVFKRVAASQNFRSPVQGGGVGLN